MKNFKLEKYWAKYEFDPILEMMGTSDLQGWDMKDILKMANPTHQKLWDNLNLGYAEVRGHPLLQKEILKTYEKPQEILVTSGAKEALYATLKGMLNPSDHVIVMSSCYQSHFEIPSSIGCQVSEWHLKMNENW